MLLSQRRCSVDIVPWLHLLSLFGATVALCCTSVVRLACLGPSCTIAVTRRRGVGSLTTCAPVVLRVVAVVGIRLVAAVRVVREVLLALSVATVLLL